MTSIVIFHLENDLGSWAQFHKLIHTWSFQLNQIISTLIFFIQQLLTFYLKMTIGSSILFQKWILGVRILWKSGITLLSRHISSKVKFSVLSDMLIICWLYIMQINKSLSWHPSFIFFNIAIDSRSIINPCTLKLLRLHIGYKRLATGLQWSQ